MLEEKSSSQQKTSGASPEANQKMRICVFTPQPPEPPVMGMLCKQMEIQKSIDFERAGSIEGLVQSVQKSMVGVAIVALNEKGEVPGLLGFLAQVEARLYNGSLRVLVINRMNHPKLVQALKGKGVAEVLDYHITIKALNLKIKNSIMIVHQAFERMKRNARTNGVSVGEANAREKGQQNVPVWEKPIEHGSDFWLITNRRNVRFVMGRWLVDLLGPGPSAGQWGESKLTLKGERGWVWRSRDASDFRFRKEPGFWVFFGKQPEFVWQKNLWSFVGKHATLAFYKESEGEGKPSEVLYHRFQADAGCLKILENSKHSESMVPEIRATLEASVRMSESEGGVPGGIANAGGTGIAETLGELKEVGMGAAGVGLGNGTVAFSKDEPTHGWNDHGGGAAGADLGGRRAEIPLDPPAGGRARRDLALPSEGGAKLGLADIREEGLKLDRRAFERVSLKMRTARGPAHFIELQGNEAYFDLVGENYGPNQPISIQAELTAGDESRAIEIQGELSRVDFANDGRSLVAVRIRDEHLRAFEAVLRVLERRRDELNHFFKLAKGA